MIGKQKPKAPRRGWTPTMERRAELNGRQVKCLIASEGHLWMRSYFDRLPPGCAPAPCREPLQHLPGMHG